MRLTGRDHQSVQRALGDLYAQTDLEALPGTILRAVDRLVPSDLAAYNEIDPTRRRMIGVFAPEGLTPRVVETIPQWERFMHQHPLVAYFHANPNQPPRRITDFVAQDRFEQTDLYRAVFEPFGVRYQVVTAIPVPQPMVAGVALNRGRPDFTPRELALLDLLRPHLRQAYENACLVSELQLKSQRLGRVIDRLDRGVIVINEAAAVVQASPLAVRLIEQHVQPHRFTGQALPPSMHDWALRQVAALRSHDDPTARPGPLMLDTPRGRLIARALPDATPGTYLVVLHHAAGLESSVPLRGLGLTDREAQVLYWCVEGKTRPEIGVLLGISDRTVQKHLEHLYAKLEVPNRVAAVTKAIEWLRW